MQDLPKRTIFQLADTYDSFYLYQESVLLERMQTLKSAFPTVKLLYSVKANPHPYIMDCIFSHGLGADAASLAEVKFAHARGVPREEIQFSAPGKRMRDLEEAIHDATLIADSVNEVQRIQKIAAERGIVAEIGLRLHPDFAFEGETPLPSKFGIDAATAFALLESWKQLPNIRIKGIHVHLRSQELRAPLLLRYYQNMLAFATRFEKALGDSLRFVNLGSGIGIPYAAEECEIDIPQLGREAADILESYHKQHPETQIYMETGRYVVGKCGTYITKVLDRKTSGGKTFVVLHNTLNGFVRPSVGCMLDPYGPTGCEPLYTGKNAFSFLPLTDTAARETVTLVGNLCTATDCIAADITLPKMDCGDLLAISNAGSYAAVLSPMQFASLVPPAQIFMDTSGKTHLEYFTLMIPLIHGSVPAVHAMIPED